VKPKPPRLTVPVLAVLVEPREPDELPDHQEERLPVLVKPREPVVELEEEERAARAQISAMFGAICWRASSHSRRRALSL
jgi:hypothetical protein